MATDKLDASMRKLDRLMSTIRSSIDENIPIQVAHAFVVVCRNEGRNVVDLADLCGASKSTMSRHLLDLSDKLRNGDTGYKLLERSQDPKNLREIIYILTPKGKLLRNSLADILED